MADLFKIAMIFTGVNRMGGVLSAVGAGLDHIATKTERLNKLGNRLMVGGAGLVGGTVAAVGMAAQKFMAFEESQIGLENTLRRADGTVSPYFATISKVAARLGTQLPGTTQDFFELASAMLKAGSGAESLANGGLEAAANMAAVLRLDYAEAGVSISKFQQALGIADRDLVSFADTIQRTAHLGVQIGEMQYAFSKLAGPLKTLGIQGIDSANKLAPVVAMLIRTGRAGEEVGTGLGNIFSVGLSQGLFTSTEGMLQFFDAMGKLDAQTRQLKLEKLFGKGGAADIGAIISTEGLAGYKKLTAEMAKQASLEQRKKASLKGLGAMYEAMMGTIENVGVAIGSVFGPELKSGAEKVNEFAGKIEGWVRANKGLISGVAKAAAGIGAFMLVNGAMIRMFTGTVKAISLVRGAFIGIKTAMVAFQTASVVMSQVFGLSMNVMKLAMIGTGIGALVIGLATAAVLVYQNWDKVKAFFIVMWAAVKPFLQPMLDFFSKMLGVISGIVQGLGKAVGLGGQMPAVAAMPTARIRTVKAAAPGGRGGVTNITYAPTVNGAGNTAEIKKTLRSQSKEMAAMVAKQNKQAARRGY